MLKIIDLKVGNIGSVFKALKHIQTDFEIIDSPDQLSNASKIILPGVGSFKAASDRLFESGFYSTLRASVIEKETPILGICVGMQLLASKGIEGGICKGLDLISGSVNKINDMNGELIIPHMGWNDLSIENELMFTGIKNKSCFYFVHSYSMTVNDDKASVINTEYGSDVVAYVNKGHIHGAQFHPEKSQSDGLQFLKNFIELC